MDRSKIGQFFKDTFKKPHLNIFHISLAIFPALALGYLTRHFIKAHLFNPYVVVSTLVIVGIIMILVEKFKPSPQKNSLDQLTYQDAVIIGIGQCFSLISVLS